MRRATLLGRVRRLCAAAERPGSAACFRSLLATRGASMQFAIVPSAVVTQAMGAVGVDGVCIDLEHGPIDFKDAQAMIASVQGSVTTPLVRVPSIDPIAVKRSLDLGAEGIVFPLAQVSYFYSSPTALRPIDTALHVDWHCHL